MTKKDEGSNTAVSLLSCIERIESLKDEQAELAGRIRDEKAAIKGMGFDIKVVNEILRRRKMKPEDREEMDSLLVSYEDAIENAADFRRAEDFKGKIQ